VYIDNVSLVKKSNSNVIRSTRQKSQEIQFKYSADHIYWKGSPVATASLVRIDGSVIQSSTQNGVIDVGHLSAGRYLVVIRCSGHQDVFQIIRN
jgi:hypothetical protein